MIDCLEFVTAISWAEGFGKKTRKTNVEFSFSAASIRVGLIGVGARVAPLTIKYKYYARHQQDPLLFFVRIPWAAGHQARRIQSRNTINCFVLPRKKEQQQQHAQKNKKTKYKKHHVR